MSMKPGPAAAPVGVAREVDRDEDEGRFDETPKRIARKKDESPPRK